MRATTLALILLCALGSTLRADDPPSDEEAARQRVAELIEKACSLGSAGSYAEARSIAQEAVTLAEKSLGTEDPDTAESLVILARVLTDMNDLNGAKPLYERALAIREKVLGPEHPATAEVLSNLAILLKDMGDFNGAKPLFERVLAIREHVSGSEHPDTARALDNLAHLLQDLGDLNGAKPLVERALAANEKALGPEHPDTADTLNQLGTLLEQMGDPEGAKPYLERALAIREKVFGPEHPYTAASLSNLAMVLQDMGDAKGARSLYERVLAIDEKVLGPEHPNTATTLNNLGVLLEDMGDLTGAKSLLERALSIDEKARGPEHPDTARALNNLATVLQGLGDLRGAKPLFARALAIWEKVLGPEHPDTATSLTNLASVLRDMGDLTEAKALYERRLTISEKVRGPEHPDTADHLSSLASVLQDMGDLKRAEGLLERALAIRQKALGTGHPETARALNNLGVVLLDMGDTKGARPLLERALSIWEKVLGPEHPETATALNNLAGILRDGEDLQGARPLYERALAIREKVLGPVHPDTAVSLGNLARLLGTMGDLEGARPLCERAQAILEKTFGPEAEETGVGLNNLAILLKDLGDLKGARPLFERALAIDRKLLGSDHPETALAINNLARLLQDTGDLAGARPLYEEAWKANRAQLHVLMPSLSGDQRRSWLRSREWALACFLRGFADEPDRTYTAALAWKGAALRTSAAAERLPQDATAELRNAAARLADARRALAGLFLGKRAPQPGEPTIREQAEAVEKEIGSLESLLADKAPDLAARAFMDTSAEDVRQALPEGAVLLDLLENYETLHAWVLGRKGDVRYFDLGKASEMEPLASRFREALEKDDAKEWEEAGAALVQSLGPSLKAALDGTRTLYLSPDGALATIPWGLLPDGDAKDRRLLVERLPIVQVHGGAGLVMAARTTGEKRGEGLLAYGDVDYTGVQPPPPPLPATKREVEGIAALYKGDARRVRMGKEASKAAFLREAGSARYVHVATHGFFDLENLRIAVGTRGFAGPVQSAPLLETADERRVGGGWNPLLLSGILLAAGEGLDGVLTAEELQSLDLRGVDLVVLSACETGRGELAAGEGVLGLSRALAIGGARGFLLSLWQVPDTPTRELMEGFYAGLWGEKPLPAEVSLRATQLRMLARDREKNAFHPKDWGAWVLIR